MGILRKFIAVTVTLTAVIIQSCVFAPTTVNPQIQQAAIARWNLCLQRFDTNPEYFCDGHRRDILATYPVHLENQINTLLSHERRNMRASRLMKTALKNAPVATEHNVPDALTGAVDTARQADL